MIPQGLKSWILYLTGLVWISVGSKGVLAQIVGDDTLPVGERSQVTGNPNFQINGGATRGNNLFHSFREFSVPPGGQAFFNNAPQIQNILTRVTGNSISNIDGLVGARGNANLFLINPNGILFGANARLAIRGSFVASTANSILLDNGFAFSATNPQAPPLLTVNAPIGLQYGTNPGSIGVQGRLQVSTGQTLALVGGEVRLDSGRLTAPGGHIELGSVAAGSLVSITPTNPGWELNYQGVQQFQDIRLTQAASVDASGTSGGSIQIQGRRLSLTEGSQIFTATRGSQAGRDLIVRATESVEVIGFNPRDDSPSSLATQARQGSTGNGGNLTIETETLHIADGAFVSTRAFGTGKGGDVVVRAQSVEVIGFNPRNGSNSFLAARTEQGSTGNAGNLTLETGTLRLVDGGVVGTRTSGAGNGGDLTVRAHAVDMIGFVPLNGSSSGLDAEARGSTGNAGNLTLETHTLRVAGSARISTRTFGSGNGGNLTVQAQSIEVIGFDPPNNAPSFLATQARPGSTGNAGNLTIDTETLRVLDGAAITTDTFGPGKAGNLTVRAHKIEVIGFDRQTNASSLLATQARDSTGNAGNLTIETETLRVVDGARISTRTVSAGNGGDLTVRAQLVEVIGFNPQDGTPSLLATEASSESTGDAGGIFLRTDRLHIANQGEIRATSRGIGSAGNIEAQAASRITLADSARISSNTNAGAGNITLTTPLLFLRRGSSITTNATGSASGGNIRFNGDFLIAVPSENSDITANAVAGSGGRVDITAQGILGIEFRPRLTPLNDITASSEFGIAGVVAINTPDVDLNRGLAELPTDIVDASRLVAVGCAGEVASQTNRGEFYQTGRGGIAPLPIDPVGSDDILEDVQPPQSWNVATHPSTAIVEAQDVQINNRGEILLVAASQWQCGQ
jgi:filamentous hemagglutinin family protein